MCWAQIPYPPERKLHMLDRLAWSEMFESFLASKYTAAKRFGLEARPHPHLSSMALRSVPRFFAPHPQIYALRSTSFGLRAPGTSILAV